MPFVSVVIALAARDGRRADDDAAGQIRHEASGIGHEEIEADRLRYCLMPGARCLSLGRVDVAPTAGRSSVSGGGPAAVGGLDGLDPPGAQDQLGVGLADGEGTHVSEYRQTRRRHSKAGSRVRSATASAIFPPIKKIVQRFRPGGSCLVTCRVPRLA
jgi:hypothetical protein